MSEELLETTYAKQQVVVTGGASFIGSHLVEALIDLGLTRIFLLHLVKIQQDSLKKGRLFRMESMAG